MTHRRRRADGNVVRRSGLAMMVVMVAISTSLILTLAFLRTQATALQISSNSDHGDFAFQAARTGASVALERIQSNQWGGVDEKLARVIFSDNDGVTSYAVRFRPLAQGDVVSILIDSALYLVIESTGTWQSIRSSTQRVEEHVEVVVRLNPRLPGRTVSPGDSTSADDLAANPGHYDEIQRHALFAGQGGKSLVLDPAGRIDGSVWLSGKLKLYSGPDWSSSVRNTFLESVAQRYASGSTVRYPHPLAGNITFHRYPSSSNRDDLNRLGTAWNHNHLSLAYPKIQYSDWQTYQLYAGGFTYTATNVGYQLRNVTLRPTPDNPLGIFYRKGSVRLDDNVTIQGTLVATEKVTITGDNVYLSSFNWRDDDGVPAVSDVSIWPRLPAITANEVAIDRNVQTSIEGAIVVTKSLRGAGGDFELADAPDVQLTGTATSHPIQQPWSIVQLDGNGDLAPFNSRGDYAIWLDDGRSGGWYPVVGIDANAGRLTVVGEVEHRLSTRFLIRRSRKHYVDIRGPVSGRDHKIKRPDTWEKPSESDWNGFKDAWEQLNLARQASGLAPIAFVDWLANPANFANWSYPLNTYGLSIEPTFQLQHHGDVQYRWSPPLFESYAGTPSTRAFAGYRWQVVSWRELR